MESMIDDFGISETAQWQVKDQARRWKIKLGKKAE
jgi:hypothetical protein